MEDQKNLITFLLLSTMIFLIWSTFGARKADVIREEAAVQEKVEQEIQAETAAEKPVELKSRDEVINAGQRIDIDTPSLKGSFLVQGSRFDNISLKNYNKTLDKDSGNVVLLSPEGAEDAAFIYDNWVIEDKGSGVKTPWSLVSGNTLTPDSTVVLRHTGDGFSVDRTISIDDKFLITLADKVTNTGADEITLVRKGLARQHGIPKGDGDARDISFILHQGAVAIVDKVEQKLPYKKFEDKREATHVGEGGWAGLTDKYWLSAAVAPQGKTITAKFKYRNLNDEQIFESGYTTEPLTLTPGNSINSVGHIFAGAKDRKTLKSYEKTIRDGNDKVVFQGISEMERAINWGRLGILVRPMTWLISVFAGWVGNYGLAIILLTTLIKLVLFPMFNKQYASQAKMKKVAPKQKRLQDMYKDDRVKLQQEVMKLYRSEGVNPLSGCLPIIPTIFVFFALYKTVFINVELRHAPFFGWLQDLSARDPLSALNGFGALPWEGIPDGFLSFLAIGPLAIFYGISMAMTFSLSSAQTPDPSNEMMQMQMKIFKWMPWIFMFVLAPFAAGLLIYWIWNNVLSILQQYYITRKYGVETAFDRFFARLRGKGKAEAE